MSTSTKSKPAAATKPALSPAELAEYLMGLADSMGGYETVGEIRGHEEAIERLKAKKNRQGARRLRVLRARSAEEGDAIAAENEADLNLKKLCQRLSGWKPLQEKGATDAQILAVLVKWPNYRSYPEKVPQAKSGYDGLDVEAWVDEDKPRSSLKGALLIAAIRRVMKIDKPAGPAKAAEKKPTPKPAPARKPAAKKKSAAKTPATPKAPADEDAGEDDLGGESLDVETKTADTFAGADRSPAKEKTKAQPAAKKEPPQPGRNSQTWRQWITTLRHLPQGVELSPKVPEFSSPTVREEFFLAKYRAGSRPVEALEAWKLYPSLEVPRPKPASEPTKAAPACRVCGCTTNDCSQCIERTGEPCTWAEDPIENGDLCTACKPPEYGQMVDGNLLGGGSIEDAVIVGVGERGGSEVYQVKGPAPANRLAWVLVKGSKVNGKARLIDTVGDEEEEDDAGDADLAGLMQDPNVNEHGVYVRGVREIVVPGIAKNHKTAIKIRVAKGSDGRYRHTTDLVIGSSGEHGPITVRDVGLESEPYAVRTAACFLLDRLNRRIQEGLRTSTEEQATAAAANALEAFIKNNPACQLKPAMANA